MLQAQLQRAGGSLHVGRGDVVAIAGEAPADNLGQDGRPAAHGAVIILHNQRGGTAAGHQAVAVAVEGAAGPCRLVLAHGEGLDAVEGGHAVHVVLLRTAAHHAVLQAVAHQQVGQAHGLRARGAGGRGGQVDAAQAEEAGQVHRHGRVHRLEDAAAAASRRVMELAEFVQRLHRGLGHRVVAVDDAHLVGGDVVGIQARVFQGGAGGHVGILRLLGHELAQVARHVGFQVGLGNSRAQGRTEARFLALLAENDSAAAVVQRLAHFVQSGSQAGPDAHAGDYYSSHCIFFLSIFFL